jgi:hypothetical protein
MLVVVEEVNIQVHKFQVQMPDLVDKEGVVQVQILILQPQMLMPPQELTQLEVVEVVVPDQVVDILVLVVLAVMVDQVS